MNKLKWYDIVRKATISRVTRNMINLAELTHERERDTTCAEFFQEANELGWTVCRDHEKWSPFCKALPSTVKRCFKGQVALRNEVFRNTDCCSAQPWLVAVHLCARTSAAALTLIRKNMQGRLRRPALRDGAGLVARRRHVPAEAVAPGGRPDSDEQPLECISGRRRGVHERVAPCACDPM